VVNGAPVPAAGDPFPYVTPDGVPGVVYRGTDNHIHALRRQGVWFQGDLSNVIVNGAPVPSAGNPFAYVTPDGFSRVIYQGQDAHIHEFFRLQGAWPWSQADLSVLSGGPPPPADGHLFAYVTPDGVPRVIYRGVEEDIHELRLQGIRPSM
jgi:hypothetical protein